MFDVDTVAWRPPPVARLGDGIARHRATQMCKLDLRAMTHPKPFGPKKNNENK